MYKVLHQLFVTVSGFICSPKSKNVYHKVFIKLVIPIKQLQVEKVKPYRAVEKIVPNELVIDDTSP